MQVLKFGGTSVGSSSAIKKVISIVENKLSQKPVLVIVSAFSGITDTLLKAGQTAAKADQGYEAIVQQIEQRHLDAVRELVPIQQQSAVLSLVKKMCNELDEICQGVFLLQEFSARTKDKVVSYGELISSQIITASIASHGISTKWLDSRTVIKTDDHFGKAAVDFSKTDVLINEFIQANQCQVFLIPGFIASNNDGYTTTLGRGGSDYTAAIFAAAVKAQVLEIWTDVSGMMTADPRWVSNARIIPQISYQEAMELSHFGAKVIYPPTIQPVMSKGIQLLIKNTFAPEDPGTEIQPLIATDKNLIRGISAIQNISLLSLEGSGMVGVPGISRRLFDALANAQINVIMITQGSSEHSITVGVETNDAEVAKAAVDKAFEPEIERHLVQPLIAEKDLSIVALVGDNMKSHQGVSGRMFATLGRNGVNVRAIAQGSSERNITAVITSADVRKAVNVLHEEFFESVAKQVHLFVIGTGNVGKRLLAQIYQQQEYLLNHLNLQVMVSGLMNSRQMVVGNGAIALGTWEEKLSEGEPSNLQVFIDTMIAQNHRNAVMVDVTADESVSKIYDVCLQKSIGVVACNKIAASSPLVNYRRLKRLSREFQSPFLFETNVGAGLPIIGTLNDLIKSGDVINRIEAVLSGTLNFVFNYYDGKKQFAEIVKQAQAEGYTEPDPRLDLSGKDVMRKILILSREAGIQMEMDEIGNNSFLPASCMEGSVADFYVEMGKHEAHFKSLLDAAIADNCKLKFVAKYSNGKASVGLQHITPDNDLYHLYGKDNVVLFYTNRYPEQPLVIKGAGAGADVTASGVFADIMRAV